MLVPPKRKKLAINNIIRCGITDNEKEASRISKAAAVRFGDIGVSMFRFPLLNQDNIKKYVTIEGKEKLDAIKESKKGCILAATHCGNWELEGAALALYGYPLLSVAMKQKNKASTSSYASTGLCRDRRLSIRLVSVICSAV